MSGLLPKKVYLYDDDGSYIREYESVSEFARQTGAVEENAFSTHYKKEVLILGGGRVAALSKVGREFIRFYKRYVSSEYSIDYRGRKIAETTLSSGGKLKSIEMINMDNEVIAVFKNMYILKKLLNITQHVSCPSGNWSSEGTKLRYV